MTDDPFGLGGEPKPKPVPRTWLGKWMRQESWWRDVASQFVGSVLAALVITIVGLIFANATGIIQGPVFGRTIASIFIVRLQVP